jgi:diaminohydroxyphosphoribosylaminopyrimidine deaminase/5-amino-6-(5-phosphoribosylamino)uracil reductase
VTTLLDDAHWLHLAVQLSRNCPPTTTAYNVGAIIVSEDGEELASGYSRDSDPHMHAEESALAKIPPDDSRLATATIYSSLEPCTERRSARPTCTDLILRVGIRRVVFAWREPRHFVTDPQGFEILTEAGVSVIELHDFENAAKALNRHAFVK